MKTNLQRLRNWKGKTIPSNTHPKFDPSDVTLKKEKYAKKKKKQKKKKRDGRGRLTLKKYG